MLQGVADLTTSAATGSARQMCEEVGIVTIANSLTPTPQAWQACSPVPLKAGCGKLGNCRIIRIMQGGTGVSARALFSGLRTVVHVKIHLC